MFGLFKTEDFHHPTLGSLKWARGCWRGETHLPSGERAPLVVGGSRKGPSTEALQHAANLSRDLQSVRQHLQVSLFEHYEPYAEAVRAGELVPEGGTFPTVNDGSQALALAEVEAVVIVELDGSLATEVCYRVPWDEEHLLGASVVFDS